jgi:acyl carrier protein
MIPSAFIVLDALPLSAHGKIDRAALREHLGRRPAVDADFAAAASDIERAIAAIWREVLGVDRVGVDDNFFEVGGQSLSLVRVHEELRARLGAELPIVELFRFPTIRALARRLSAPARPKDATREEADRGQRRRAAMLRARRG